MPAWKYVSICQVCRRPVGPGRSKGMCQSYYHKAWNAAHPVERKRNGRNYYRRHKAEFNRKVRERQVAFRVETIRRLGGRCACCGETEIKFLCIDHVKGGGRREHRRLGGSVPILRAIRKEGYPTDAYRILCWNCNAVMSLWGRCPHSSLTGPSYRAS